MKSKKVKKEVLPKGLKLISQDEIKLILSHRKEKEKNSEIEKLIKIIDNFFRVCDTYNYSKEINNGVGINDIKVIYYGKIDNQLVFNVPVYTLSGNGYEEFRISVLRHDYISKSMIKNYNLLSDEYYWRHYIE